MVSSGVGFEPFEEGRVLKSQLQQTCWPCLSRFLYREGNFMKKIFFIVVLSGLLWGLSHKSLAGEMSKIDQAVREEVKRVYSQNGEDGHFNFDEQKDIWALEIISEPGEKECFAFVTGLAKRPSRNGVSTYRFWTCVNRDDEGYFAELWDDEQIAEE